MTSSGTGAILLVEDEPAVRMVVRRMLEALGHEVVDAAGPIEALELLANEATAVDLLLSDVVMPVMSGPDLAFRVRHVQPDVRVLYMSGFNDRQVDGPLLRKPFSVEELAASVRELLDGVASDALLEPIGG